MTRPEEAGLIPVTVGEWHARPERLAEACAYVAAGGGGFIAVTVEPASRAGYFDLLFRVGEAFRTVPREAPIYVLPDHYEALHTFPIGGDLLTPPEAKALASKMLDRLLVGETPPASDFERICAYVVNQG